MLAAHSFFFKETEKHFLMDHLVMIRPTAKVKLHYPLQMSIQIWQNLSLKQ